MRNLSSIETAVVSGGLWDIGGGGMCMAGDYVGGFVGSYSLALEQTFTISPAFFLEMQVGTTPSPTTGTFAVTVSADPNTESTFTISPKN